MGKTYVMDGTFQISDEIRKMSVEERRKQIKIWEEEGRKEKERIQKQKTLKTFFDL